MRGKFHASFPIIPTKEHLSTWVEYFTKPNSLNQVSSKLQKPIDLLLDSFKYTPKTLKQVKIVIKKSQNPDLIEKNLADLFEFNNFSFINYFMLCKTAVELFDSCKSSPNIESIPVYILRGFFMLSYRLKDIVTCYLNGETVLVFPEQFWEMIHFPLVYLLNDKHDINLFNQTIKTISPFLDSFSNHGKLSSFQNLKSSLKLGFMSIIKVIIPAVYNEIEQIGSSKLFNFVSSYFLYVAKNPLKNLDESIENKNLVLKENNEVMNLAFGFIKFLMPKIDELVYEQLNQLVDLYLSLLVNISYFSQNSVHKSVNFSIDCLNLLCKIIQQQEPNEDLLVNIVHSLISMLIWFSDQISIESFTDIELLTAAVNNKMTDIVQFKTWNDYFQSSQLVPDLDLFKTKNKELEGIIIALRNFFSEINQGQSLLPFVFKLLIGEVARIDFIKKKMELCIIFFRVLFEIMPIKPNDFLQAFLFSTLFPNCFPLYNYTEEEDQDNNEAFEGNQNDNNIDKKKNNDENMFKTNEVEINKRDKKMSGVDNDDKSIKELEFLYQNVYICFLFRISIQGIENTKFILKMIGPIITGNGFPRTIYFLPVLRSCMMFDNQIDFVDSYLVSGIYEGIQLAFINPNYENLVNELVAFFQVMICYRPIETFASFAFIPIIKNTLLKEKLQDAMLPCFQIGLNTSLRLIMAASSSSSLATNANASTSKNTIYINGITNVAKYVDDGNKEKNYISNFNNNLYNYWYNYGIESEDNEDSNSDDEQQYQQKFMVIHNLSRKAAVNIIEQILFVLCDSSYKKHMISLAHNMIKIVNDVVLLIKIDLAEEIMNDGFLTAVSSLAINSENVDTLHVCLTFFVKFCYKFPSLVHLLNDSVVLRDICNASKQVKLNGDIIIDFLCLTLNEVSLSPAINPDNSKEFDSQSIIEQNFKISNNYFLKLLLTICQDTEYEKFVLSVLHVLCQSCLSNCFSCFSSDLIGIVLKRLDKDDLFDVSLALFKTIGSKFYSPLAMNHTFLAMRLTKDGKRPKYLNKLIDCYLNMISNDTVCPISSFFNFMGNSKSTGIFDVKAESISFPFSIVATFRRAKPINFDSPLFSLQNSEDFYLTKKSNFIVNLGENSNSFNSFVLYLKDEKMFICQNEFSLIHIPELKILCNVWYKIYVVFLNSSTIQIHLSNLDYIKNNKFDNSTYSSTKLSYISTSPISLSNKVDFIGNGDNCFYINIGCYSHILSFSGDIGPFFFIKSINITEIEEADYQINVYRKINKNVLIKFLPWEVNRNKNNENSGNNEKESTKFDSVLTLNDISKIENIDKKSTSSILVGNAIPYCSSITDVFNFKGIFEHFLPLFLLLNYPVELYENEKEEKSEDINNLFHKLLLILKHILYLSESNQQNFENTGGFQLLSGIFSQLKPSIFSPTVSVNLYSIFEIISLKSLRAQMTQFIWLNFDLWYRMNYEFQTKIFEDILYKIWAIDLNSENHTFVFSSLDFLLFLVQKFRGNQKNIIITTPAKHENENDNFNNDKDGRNVKINHDIDENDGTENNDHDLNIISFPGIKNDLSKGFLSNLNELNKEEENHIKLISWQFFSDLLESNPSPSTFLTLFVVVLNHEDDFTKNCILSRMENYLSKNEKNILISLNMVDRFDVFIRVIEKNESLDIKLKAIQCIFTFCKTLKYTINSGNNNVNNNNANINKISQLEKEINTAFEKIINALIGTKLDEKFSFAIFADLYDIPSEIKLTEVFYFHQISLIKNVILFPLFVYFCGFISKHEIAEQFAMKIGSSIVANPQSFTAYFNENKSWPFWVFLFGVSVYRLGKNLLNIVHFFTIFLSNYLGNGNGFNEILRFFSFINFVEINLFVNLWQIKSALLTSLINRLISVNKMVMIQELKNISILTFNSLFFSLKINNEKKIENLDDVSFQDVFNLIFLMNETEENDLHLNEFEFEFVIRMDNNELWLDHELGMKLNYLISKILKEDLNDILEIIPNEISIKTSQIFSLINPMLHKCAEKKMIQEQKIYSYQDFPSIQYNSSSNFFDVLKTKPMNYKKYIAKQIHIIKKDIIEFYPILTKAKINPTSPNIDEKSMKKNDIDEKNYKAFVSAHEQAHQLMILHNHKLATSFIREVTSNGGPWSSELKTVKWKASTKIDSFGRNIFATVNRNFDDHRKASAMRDSTPYLSAQNEEDEEKEISFKRILGNSAKNLFIPDSSPQQFNVVANNYTCRAVLITLTKQISGLVHISETHFIFEGSNVSDICGNNLLNIHKLIEIPLKEIGYIFTRKTLHMDIGIEIFTNINRSFLINFVNTNKRTEFLNNIKKITSNINNDSADKDNQHSNVGGFLKYFRKASNGSCVQTISSFDLLNKSRIVKKWQNKKISNFTYLFIINILSGRSLNDLSQYPVFPWILSNYTSEELDLNDPENFRDLSKPVGALNEQRLEQLKNIMNEMENDVDKCLYCSFFSSPLPIIGFLIRTEPFSTLHISLQGGRFDHSSRLFYTVSGAYSSVTSLSHDYRELIPEFFCSPSFLINENGFDLGKVHRRSQSVNDVILPAWAKSAHEFIAIHRKALESDHVSQHLNEWIDLIFGVNQYSPEYNSIFHTFSYGDRISGVMESEEIRLKSHCANFGCFPSKLFANGNSPRRETRQISNSFRLPPSQNAGFSLVGVTHSLSNGSLGNSNVNPEQIIEGKVIYLKNDRSLTTKFLDRKLPVDLPLYSNEDEFVLNKDFILFVPKNSTSATIFDAKLNKEIGCLTHKNCIINCLTTDGNYVVTGGSSCVAFVWDLKNLLLIDVISFHSLPITSIDCNKSLDLLITIDEGHNIFIQSLSSRKFIHTFRVNNCHPKANHLVKILENGYILISSSVLGEDVSAVEVFDLKGSVVEKIEIDGKVLHFDSACFVGGRVIFAISTNKKKFFVVDCEKFSIIKVERDKYMVPGIIAVSKISKTVSIVQEKNGNNYIKTVGYD